MYDTLDSLIVAAVRRRVNPLYDSLIWMESYRLEKLTGRITSRITDGRLQSLRKRGVIEYRTKNDTGGKAGWYLLQGKGHE